MESTRGYLPTSASGEIWMLLIVEVDVSFYLYFAGHITVDVSFTLYRLFEF